MAYCEHTCNDLFSHALPLNLSKNKEYPVLLKHSSRLKYS